MAIIDLHTHSSASDGELSPRELVAKAYAMGLQTLALTDHDSVAGLAEASQAAQDYGMEFIPGIEIEIEFNPGECHLLGYGIDHESEPLQEVLSMLAQARHDRNWAMLEKLREEGFRLDYESILATSSFAYIGRPHLADLLVRAGHARTRQDAFDRYLGKGRPFYLKKACLELDDAIARIEAAGGIAVLAHPYSLFVSKSMLAAIFDAWKEKGIRGIEAYHPTAKYGQCVILERMARERGLFVTAGSDFHGARRPECGLGKTAGGVPISHRFRDELVHTLELCRRG
ncbi:MAG: PHP domain-containing protein [Spirochaetales bacterium]|nr:PHP domain-containing protein [Spirochaetales bacterium]